MKPYKPTFIFACLFIGLIMIKAQDDRPSIDKGSIDSRFNYVIQKSEDFEDSKLVKKWMLYRLRTYVADSLNALKSMLTIANSQISSGASGVDSLNFVISELNENLNVAVKEKNSMTLAGLKINKQSYNIVMWTLVAAVAFFMIIFFFLFKRSNSITVRTIHQLNETKEEFESFRKRALEREQRVVREMYDEILKYKNKAAKNAK